MPVVLGLGKADLTPSTRTPLQIVLAFGFAFGGAFIAALALQLADIWPVPVQGEVNTFTAASAVVFQLGLFAGLAHAWFWHMRKTPQPPAPALPVRRVIKAALVTFCVLVFAMGATAVLWEYVLDAFGVRASPQDIVTLLARRGNAFEITAVLLGAVTLAPITEEILFRVLLFRWVRTRFARGVVLLVPAAFFAFIHGFIAVFGPLMVLSIVLALAYERTGHPAVPILAHALFNLNTILIVLVGLSA